MNRIQNIPAKLILFFLYSFISCQQQTNVSIEINRINDNVIVFDYLSVNTTAISTEKGIVIIDTHRAPAVMLKIKNIVEKEFGREDFVYVINTHGHWDHCSGNQVFTNARIVAHQNCSQYLKNYPANSIRTLAGIKHRISKIKNRLIDSDENTEEYILSNEDLSGWELVLDDLENNYISTPPSVAFSDSLILDLGNVTIRLIYCGRSHTDNHIFVSIPQENLVFTGDMFTSNVNLGFPVNKMVDVPRILIAIDHIISIGDDKTKVIPGHGKILSGSDLVYLREKVKRLYSEFEDKKSSARYLEEMMANFELDSALKKFNELTSSQKNEFYLLEEEFLLFGNVLLGNGKISEATAVFKECTRLFPSSALAYDHLANAFLKKGDFQLSIENYKKSLSIFPQNGMIKEILSSIGKNE